MNCDYISRLNISTVGNIYRKFFTKSGELFAIGYNRVEIGGRGPYIEFNKECITSKLFIPIDQEWRINSKKAYYIELRSIMDNIKVYYQKKEVTYAIYIKGYCYVNPFDLNIENGINVID